MITPTMFFAIAIAWAGFGLWLAVRCAAPFFREARLERRGLDRVLCDIYSLFIFGLTITVYGSVTGPLMLWGIKTWNRAW